ncbi:MAG: PCMD domain-containing protein, partial [Muribaculaceae bacterium]|nr:PCMD domain-containing protein [Muribaculaceae bacterium]
VLYEVTPEMETLDGTNVLAEDNPNIVATAIIPDEMRVLAEEWTEFNILFKYREGKEVDPQKLAEGGYNIVIVFSSSIDGDYFSGAPGSTLLVDDVELGCQE